MLDLSIATHTGYEDGVPTTQIQPIGAGATSHPGHAYHPFGFKGRPNDPLVDADQTTFEGCRVLLWYEGNTLHTMRLDDPRRTAKLPQLPKGSSMQYADVDDAHAVFSGVDGSYVATVPDGVTAKIGDANAVPVAKAQLTQDALDALVQMAWAMSGAINPQVGEIKAAGAAFLTALGLSPSPALAPIGYTDIATKKLEGT